MNPGRFGAGTEIPLDVPRSVSILAAVLTQPDLFAHEAEPSPGGATLGLILGKGRGQQLTRAQRAFNRLVRRIETLRRDIQNEVQRLNGCLAYYAAELHPLKARICDARKAVVRLLFPFLKGGPLGFRGAKPRLRQVIQEHFHGILGESGQLPDEDLRAIFEAVERKSIRQAEAEDFDAMREGLGDAFADLGIDVDLSDLRPDMSPEEIASRMEEIRARFEQSTERQQARPRTRQERAREERERAAEELRTRDIGGLYRRLAKLLHPDLEPDPGLRVEKEAAMKQLTTAYKSNDLHALLRLELAWIVREQADAIRLTDEKLAVYNAVLREQVKELEAGLADVKLHPRFQPLRAFIDPYFGYLTFDGPALKRELTRVLLDLETSLAALRGPKAREKVLAILEDFAAAKRGGPELW